MATVTKKTTSTPVGPIAGGSRPKKVKPWRPRVPLRDLSNFARQFTTMYEAGVNIVTALHFYAKGESGPMKRIINECADNISSGYRFSSSLARYPSVFDPIFVGLVAAGEGSGELGVLMHKLANLLERQDKFRQRTKSALVYPGFLLMTCIAVGLVFMFFILPSLEPMLTTMGVQPPWPTKVMLIGADFLRSRLFLGIDALLVAAFVLGRPVLVAYLARSPETRIALARFWLELPYIGKLSERILLARMLFTMATCLDTGQALTASLEMASQVAGNAYAQQQIRIVRMEIEDGETLSVAMQRCSLFPRGLIQMTRVGEETSSLAVVMRYCANLYEDIADTAIQTAVSLFEPILMAGMGVMAGFLVLASMMPIVKMIQSL